MRQPIYSNILALLLLTAGASIVNASERLEQGRTAYQQACATCHEQGVNNAPWTGRAEDWADRSKLWEAVLFEHADKGYLSMPAKGGNSALSEYEVETAAEYMLGLVYPSRLRD